MTGLQVLAQGLKKLADDKYKIQVGVFGDKDVRTEDAHAGPTNAEVGIKQELGSVSERIPRRSFLWDTFTEHFQELEAEIKEKKLVEKYLQVGQVDAYLKKTGAACENLVRKAFLTGGFGNWPKLAQLTIQLRRQRSSPGGEKPLIDTSQLMHAISSRTVRS